ncbi:MAG: DUF1501 domain-containing protein [Bryobacteraceae bacterium]
MTRRQLLSQTGNGFGMLALAQIAGQARETANPLAPKAPHFPAKAKRVVYLYLNGGPSQVDTFDPKPDLTRFDGKSVPDSLNLKHANGTLLGSPFQFRKHGQSGVDVSELFPELAKVIDECCVIRSMHCDNPGHEVALMQTNTGRLINGHPSMGSWVTYGLGTENQNLPGFVVLCPGLPVMGSQLWSAAYLPGVYQGVHVRNREEEDPARLIHYVRSQRRSANEQRRQLDLLGKLNRYEMERDGFDAELDAGIQNMELAFRMQTEAVDAFDVRKETAATRARYGEGYMASGCLIARRLLERGVRMVQVYFGNRNPWDSHADIFDHRKLSYLSDQPMAALIGDLKASGLLEETIVMIGGEFGRTPSRDGDGMLGYGRGHNHLGFTMVMAGGGFKKGLAYGATDDLGWKAVENPVHIHDLHATVLHQLGLDHTKLTFRHSGRDFRLTDVAGKVVREVLA